MSQMYEIFINDLKFIISQDKINGVISEKFKEKSQIIHTVKNMFDRSINTDRCLYGKNTKDIFKIFSNSYIFLKSAGGLVFNENINKILWIYRLDKWDLPKGKVEDNETPEQTCMREIEEECGIKNVVIQKKLGSSFHMYSIENNFIIKEVLWYKMKTRDNEVFPQLEEGITKVEWKSKEEHYQIVKNNMTYLSIKNFIEMDDDLFFI